MMYSIDTIKYKRRLKVDSLEKREGLSLMWLVKLPYPCFGLTDTDSVEWFGACMMYSIDTTKYN